MKTKCLSTNPEKIVYQAIWKGKEIILKYDTHTKMLNSYSYEHLKDENDYINEIEAAVNMLFGESENSTTLANKLVETADVNYDGQLSFTETKMMLQLLRTTEPSMLLVLNGSKVALDFYGFCGRLYAVEKLAVVGDTVYGMEMSWEDFSILPNIFEPIENYIKQIIRYIFSSINSFDFIYNNTEPLILKLKTLVSKTFFMSRIPSIEERFSFVLNMLDVIFEISNSSSSLVQGCDTHLGNFGMTDKKELKFLDYDLVYPLHYLKQLLSSKSCSHNDDCKIGDFDDCTSDCNQTTGFCSDVLNFDMLQVMCVKAFPLIFRNIYMDFRSSDETELKCLEDTVKNIAWYCYKMDPVKNITQLYTNMQFLKQKLFSFSKRNSYCGLS